MNYSGILLPVFSLSSTTGMGCFSREAFDFIDFLAEAGQRYWQILPLGPIDKWFSPYQPCSCYAGEPLFIDPLRLRAQGLISDDDLTEFREAIDQGEHTSDAPQDLHGSHIDYMTIRAPREALLKKACANFFAGDDEPACSSTADGDEEGAIPFAETPLTREGYHAFLTQNAHWLDDYCLFLALRDHFDQASWTTWDEDIRSREDGAIARYKELLADAIRLRSFQQYVFFAQWAPIRRYAHTKGIEIIGDMPFYVTLESVDCWAHPELFQLDESFAPIAVSGAPADGFDENGQLWNSPLYDWDAQRDALFTWWTQRLAQGYHIYDIIRLDHVRAFADYFSIPAEDTDVKRGVFRPGPGTAIFHHFTEQLGKIKLIAEDLGYLSEEVHTMLREASLPGMKVLQFAFDSGRDNPYLPENIGRHAVVYTGTHDNPTTCGWYKELSGARKHRVDSYLRCPHDPAAVTRVMICLAMNTRARIVIIPIQDYMELDNRARINTPGTTVNNWTWMSSPGSFTDALSRHIRSIVSKYGRDFTFSKS